MNRTHRTTLSEIARKAGVSRQVVSAVLFPERGKNIRFSNETRDKVTAIVKSTNFRPNRTAINLVRNRHGSIGVLIHDYGLLWGNVIEHMLKEAYARGQILVLDYIPDDPEKLPSIVSQDAVDGIVVFEEIGEKLQQTVDRLKIPCGRVNTNVREVEGSITFDEIGAMERAVSFIKKKGKRSIALFVTQQNHYSQQLRQRGLIQAAAKHKLPLPVIHTISKTVYDPGSETIMQKEMKTVLVSNPKVDAVILSQDSMAPNFYKVASILHKKIPEDLIVMGFNNSNIAWAVEPKLTSLHVDSKRVGQQANKMINSLINGDAKKSPVVIGYSITERESTGK